MDDDLGRWMNPDVAGRPVLIKGNTQLQGVQIAIADAAEAEDHRVSPEEAVRIAMARQ